MTMTELEALRCVLNTAEQQAEEAHDNNEDEVAMLSEACEIVQSLIHRAEQGSATEYGVEDMVRQVLRKEGVCIWQTLDVQSVVDAIQQDDTEAG
jgi:uncharacterized protein with ATP-grasp and redox domains